MLKKVCEIVARQNRWRRRECINLIASENVLSPLAEKFLLSDFHGRYNEHDEKTHYQGVRYAVEIEELVNRIFGERFSTELVDCRPISGSVANLCVYHAFLNPGDCVVTPGISAGAHVSASPHGIVGVKGATCVEACFDAENFELDVDKTLQVVKKANPKMLVLGRSVFLFPEPVRELRSEVGDMLITYDAAHVFGLIYCGFFQKPLEEGADVLTASTHKTFPGPQGGIVIARRDFESGRWKRITRALFPGIVSNHHIFRLPSLAITALEMNEFGREYCRQILSNARALAQRLHELGFRVLCEHRNFTRSHQILLDVRELGGGAVVAKKLEDANIIVNKIALPWDSASNATRNPSGIRIGVQEMTRVGMKEDEMREIAELFGMLLLEGRKEREVRERAIELRRDFTGVKYCFRDAENSDSFLD